MARKKTWIIALSVGCAAVLVAIVVVVLVAVLGAGWLVTEMERAGAEPLTAMEVRECELIRDGARVTARGSVSNGGRGSIDSVQLRLLWADGSGTSIAEDGTSTFGDGGLAPGESGEFELVREDPTGAIEAVTCRIQCVHNAQGYTCY